MTAPELDLPAIDALDANWREAFARGDVDAIMGLLTPDYVLSEPGTPPIGVAETWPRLEATIAPLDVRPRCEGVELTVSGGFGVIAVMLLCVGLPATSLPARRTTRVEPTIALRAG